MPIKWRLVLLSIAGTLLASVVLFTFTAQLFTALVMETEQDLLANKVDTLRAMFEQGEEEPDEKWLLPFVEEGQAIRVIRGGKPIFKLNHGVPEVLFPDPAETPKSEQIIKLKGKSYSLLSRPFQGTAGRVELVTDFAFLERYRHNLNQALFLGAILLLLLITFGSYGMSTIALRPVNRITETVRRLDPNDVGSHLDVPATRDEIAKLSVTFNQLLERIHQLLERQKQWVADASHELRTPIAVIQGYVRMLDRWGLSDRQVARESLSAIKQETDRMNRLTTDLLKLARMERGFSEGVKREEVDIGVLMEEQMMKWQQLHPERTYVCRGKDKGATAYVERYQIEECIHILMDNAVKYTDAGGTVGWRVHASEEVCLSIDDDGAGIPAEEQALVFERFYRVDKSRSQGWRGSGLGLAIAKRIAETHHGHIRLQSSEGQGTTITICLPRSQ